MYVPCEIVFQDVDLSKLTLLFISELLSQVGIFATAARTWSFFGEILTHE